MNNKFQKLYNDIINEANKENKKWVQLPTYKGVNKYYSENHVDDRTKKRYKEKISYNMIHQLINMFIDELNRRNAWKGITSEGKGFTFHATKSNKWFSGVVQKDQKTNKKELFVSTFLPPTNTRHNPYDIVIKLDI